MNNAWNADNTPRYWNQLAFAYESRATNATKSLYGNSVAKVWNFHFGMGENMRSTMFFAAAALSVSALAGLSAPSSAAVVTIDFEGFADGQTISGIDLGGVTLTRGPSTLVISDPPRGLSERGIKGEPFSGGEYRADFAEDTTFVSIDLGDFGGDEDTLYLRAFDFLGNLIDSASEVLARSTEGLRTLEVTGGAIAYVLFGSSGDFESSVYADNLSFERRGGVTPDPEPDPDPQPSPVPLPAGGALLFGGLLGLSALRRRCG